MRKGLAICALVLMCCCGSGQRQNSAPPPGSLPQHAEAPPHAPAESLPLAVVVTDKAGQPVAGVQQSDFTVLDNKNPAPINFFYAHHDSPPQTAEESIMLLIDDVNVNFNSLSFERGQIESFLRGSQGHLPAPLSIVLLTETDITPVIGPSSDAKLLADEFQQWEGHLRTIPWSADWGATERWEDSLRALAKVAAYDSRHPGRKLLIWIGPGWSLFENPGMPINDDELHAWMGMIVRTSGALREGRITLYSVDPQGLGAGLFASAWQSFLKPVKKWDQALPGDLSLQALATESGGQVLYTSNDIGPEIAQCVDDASTWYTLVIPLQKSDRPDIWHEVQVKVDRPGVIVRTRNGYYAQP